MSVRTNPFVTGPARVVGVFVCAWIAVAVAILAAPMGLKGLGAVVIGVSIGLAAWALGKRREDLFLVGLVMTIGFLLHKAVGPINYEVNGGAPAIYITSTGAVLAVLYALWFVEGTLIDDVRAAFREQRVLWAPLVGALFLLPSLLPVGDVNLAFAEIARMGWMYLLFVYLCCRIRSRHQVQVVLLAVAGLACIEFVVVCGQWLTGSTLGLGFLGLPPELGERILSDSGRVLRPFGTVTHPVFMGSVVGPIAVLALAMALHLRDPKQRLFALLVAGIAGAPLAIAHTRAAALGAAVAGVILVVGALARRRLRLRPFFGWVCLGAIALVALWGPISAQFNENWGTDHFSLEVESRTELNDVAVEMFTDHPIAGAGLNQFQTEMVRYDTLGLIFAGNPVHNIYLLYLAETGILGLTGVLVVGLALVRVAWRLRRSDDPLYSAMGYGMLGVYAFFAVQEMLLFALRIDHPLALFWLLSGVLVGVARIAERASAPTDEPIVVAPDDARELAAARR